MKSEMKTKMKKLKKLVDSGLKQVDKKIEVVEAKNKEGFKKLEAKLSMIVENVNSTNQLLDILKVEADKGFTEINQLSREKFDDLNMKISDAMAQIQQDYLDINHQISDLKTVSNQDYQDSKDYFSELRGEIQQAYQALKQEIIDLNRPINEARSEFQQAYQEVKQQISEINQENNRHSANLKGELKQLDSRFWGLMTAFIGLLLLEIFRIFLSLV